MQRPRFSKQADILIVTDYPTADEAQKDNFWFSASHLELLADLAKVGIKETINLGTIEEPDIKPQISTTHLSFYRPEKENFDFFCSFTRKANAEEPHTQIPWEKHLFCKDDLWKEVIGLIEQIKKIKPKFIIVAGKWSLYFLSARVPYNKTQGTKTSKKPLGGLSSHRGSITKVWEGWGLAENIIIYPVLPASEKWRSLNERRVKTEKAQTFCAWDWKKFSLIFQAIKGGASPDKYLNPNRSYNFLTSMELVEDFFQRLENDLSKGSLYVSTDIETRFNLIDCIGFCWDNSTAYCLPIATIENPVPWTLEEEAYIIHYLSKLLTHKNFKGVFQNGSFDIQVIEKAWGIWVNSSFDTMLAGHCLFNTLKKDLATLASINCTEYSYWKDAQTHEEEELAK